MSIASAINNFVSSVFQVFQGLINSILAVFQSVVAVFTTLVGEAIGLFNSLVAFFFHNIFTIGVLAAAFVGYQVYLQNTNKSTRGGLKKKL